MTEAPASRFEAFTKEGLRLRHAVEGDLPKLRAIYVAARACDREQFPSDWDEVKWRAFLEQQFTFQRRHYAARYPEAEFTLLEHSGYIAGWMYVNTGPSDMHLVDIMIAPDYRNRGLGSMMIRGIQEAARLRRSGVSLEVNPLNPARRLYARLGFAPVAEDGISVRMRWAAE